jgi:uncharacterized damage-inducible protein DinB
MEIVTIAPFLDYFARVRERTSRVARRIPPEHLEWSWRDGKFTPGDLVRHIAATERWMFAENVARRPSLYPGHGRELAEGFDATLAYLDAMHRESLAIIAALSDADLRERCTTPGGVAIPVWKWLRSMVEHEVHHRGQIYLLLSMLDVDTPPLYGLTSEQVRENSGRKAEG